MVQIFPSTLNEVKEKNKDITQSEILIFEYCMDLGDEWVVWHSSDWFNEEDQKIGETDFVILNRQRGFIVIEVKGGKIEYSGSKWNTLNKTSPFHQARVSMFFWANKYVDFIKKYYFDKQDILLKKDKFPGIYRYACAFPFTPFKKQIISKKISLNEASIDMIFDQSDCDEQESWKKIKNSEKSPFEKFLIQLFDSFDKNAKSLNQDVSDKFIEMMNGMKDHNIDIIVERLIEKKHQMLNEIIENQEYYRKLFTTSNFLIYKGSAGTGKTLIAINEILYSLLNGKRVLYICFNKELKNHIQSIFYSSEIPINLKENPFYPDGYPFYEKIRYLVLNKDLKTRKEMISQNIDGFLKIIFYKYRVNGIEYDYDKYEFDYKKIAENLKILIERTFNIEKYDVILVDEAQDIHEDLFFLFNELLKDKKNSKLYIFYDDQQNIFRLNETPKKFRKDLDIPVINLKSNIRNAQDIIETIKNQLNMGDYEQNLNLKSIIDVEIIRGVDLIKSFKTIVKKIYELIVVKNLNSNRIIILSQHTLDFYKNTDLGKYISKKNSENNRFKDYYCYSATIKDDKTIRLIQPEENIDFEKIKESYDNDDILILWNSIHKFKGLEKEVVVLFAEDNFNENNVANKDTMKLLYVGFTRSILGLICLFYKK